MAKSREVMWRRTADDASFEHCKVREEPEGYRLSGTVLIAEDGIPLHVRYNVACDRHWQTRQVHVEQTWGGKRSALQLEHDGLGGWRLNGKDAPHLAGCTDVDLGVSPSTNALPINRLKLPVGATAEIRAAWMLFPALDIVAAGQSYERLAANQYRYRSLGTEFEALLDVDDDGLPITYADLWERVAESTATTDQFPPVRRASESPRQPGG